ncbi:MAG: hypothetical protein WAV48_07350 [Candidatus Magasanikiibacteriota bacterium]
MKLNATLRSVIITITSFVFVITAVHAWTGPSVSAPNGNVSAPVTVSATNQEKTGGLWLGSLGITGKAVSSSTVDSDPGNTLVTKDYLDARLAALGGGGASCNQDSVTFTEDGTYTIPVGITALTFESTGGGGGGGGGDGSGSSGQGSGPGGTGGNSGVVKSSDGSVLTKANGGAGGAGEGDSCCTSGSPGNGANGQRVTQTIQVTPGEVLNIKVGGGGGGGHGDYVHFSGPAGGAGVHGGANFEGSAGGWYCQGYVGMGGTGASLKGGRGTDSGVDGNGCGLNGTAQSLSSGTGAGGAGSPADIYGYGGQGGDGGKVIVRTPTATELGTAGLTTFCSGN